MLGRWLAVYLVWLCMSSSRLYLKLASVLGCMMGGVMSLMLLKDVMYLLSVLMLICSRWSWNAVVFVLSWVSMMSGRSLVFGLMI